MLRFSLAILTALTIAVVGSIVWDAGQHLDDRIAVQGGLSRAEHLAEAAGRDLLQHLEFAEPATDER